MTLFHRKQNISSDLMEFFLEGSKMRARALCTFLFFGWQLLVSLTWAGLGHSRGKQQKRVTLNEQPDKI